MLKKILKHLIKVIYKITVYFGNKYSGIATAMIYSQVFKRLGPGSTIRKPHSLYGAHKVSIGKGFDIYPGARIEAFDKHNNNYFEPSLIIGDNVSINYNFHCACINRIEIGNNVLIGSNVLITDHSHFSEACTIPYSKQILHSKGAVIIEDNVWLCENVCILAGVTIGANSIIAAGSVVNSNIPSNVLASGNPAKVIKWLQK